MRRYRSSAQGLFGDYCRRRLPRAGLTRAASSITSRGKQELAAEAAAHFSFGADELFARGPYQALPDRSIACLAMSTSPGDPARASCRVHCCRHMVQEAYDTHPPIRAACDGAISHHAASLEADIAQSDGATRASMPVEPPQASRSTCKPSSRARSFLQGQARTRGRERLPGSSAAVSAAAARSLARAKTSDAARATDRA